MKFDSSTCDCSAHDMSKNTRHNTTVANIDVAAVIVVAWFVCEMNSTFQDNDPSTKKAEHQSF